MTEITTKDVEVKVHPKPNCLVELHVTASPSLVRAARKAAAKKVGKEVSLPGFRKGKVPQDMVEKKFPQHVDRELQQSIANLAFPQALKASQVSVLNQNSKVSFDLKESGEHGAILTFSFETDPSIPSVDFSLFQPKKEVEKKAIGEKEVNEAIHQARFFYANWTPIQDRGIQLGDYVMIDLDTLDGEKAEKVFRDVRFEVSAERMANWMQQLILGAKWGDVLEGMSEPDETASEEEKKEFQPKKVRLTVLRVEEALLPELNDEFAGRMGAKNVQDLKDSIQKMLEGQEEERIKGLLREEVNKFFSEQYQFELPTSLITTEKEHRRKQMMQNPEFQKEWDAMSPDKQSTFEQNLTQESEEAVRLFYISRHIVEEAHLPITHKEVQDRAVRFLQKEGFQNIDIAKIPREIYAIAFSQLLLAKAQDVVIEKSKSSLTSEDTSSIRTD